jgi:hypothetical protein
VSAFPTDMGLETVSGDGNEAETVDFPMVTDPEASDVDAATAPDPDDAFLDKTLTDGPGDAEPRREDDVAPSEPEQPAGSDPEQPSAESASDETNPPQVSPEDYNRAMTALRRANTPQDVIEQMAKENPAGLLSWGSALAEQHAQVDNFGNELAQLKAQVNGTAPPQRGEQTDIEPDAQGQQRPPSDGEPVERIRSRVSELTTGLAEHWGEEGVKPMVDALTGTVQMIDEAFSQAMQQRDQALQYIVGVVERMETDSVRASLGDRFPQLNTAEGWKTVETALGKLNRSQFTNVQDAVEAAALLSFGDANLKTFQDNLARQHAARTNGQPQSDTKATAPRDQRKKSMTAEEQEDLELERILGR